MKPILLGVFFRCSLYRLCTKYTSDLDIYTKCKKLEESRNGPGVAQSVPGGLGSQIS